MQVEPVNEEEVTKIEVTGTHDYPSAPGFVFFWIFDRKVYRFLQRQLLELSQIRVRLIWL